MAASTSTSRKSRGRDAERKEKKSTQVTKTTKSKSRSSNGVVKELNTLAESKSKAQSKPRSKSSEGGKEKEGESEDGNSVCTFPMNRIKVITRSGEDTDSRITQEAIFLINKASEKFIENMCEDSYISDKNYFGYKHISSLVGRERRYYFLSDFVPERVKAADALAETQVAEA